MPNADEDALRAIRAASTALQERWPEGESPRAWQGVEWSGDRVQELVLDNSGLEELPPQIGQLTALTNLSLYGCKQLKELPPQIAQLTALTHLNLTNCVQLKELPPQIGQLTALTHLLLYYCKQLKELPPQIGQLTALTKLDLSQCKRLKELPPQIGQLTALTNLDLSYCELLKELPPQIGQLTALTDLDLCGCDQLTLAPGAEEVQQAQTIVAIYARLLIVEPRKDTPSDLHAFLLANPLWVPAFFKHIVGDLTDYGEAISAWLGEAIKATPELANLTAPDGCSVNDVAEQARLSRATAKPDEDALRAIRAASTALQELWPEGKSPRSWRGVEWRGDRVRRLNLTDSGLEVLAPQIGQLTALTDLDLCGCKQLKELPPQIGQLTALTDLSLLGCEQLKELPPQFGQLLALTDLMLDGCNQLTLAPGAKDGQRAPTIVAAYAPLLIFEPRKDAPGELHAFLRANPLAMPAFVKTILTDAAYAAWLCEAIKASPSLARELNAFLLANPLWVPDFFKHVVGDLTGEAITAWLGEAIKATPELANLTSPEGRSVNDVAEQARLSRATAKPDEDALRVIRAASTVLQKRWPEGKSPRSWRGVTWSGDRVQELDLSYSYSGLEVLPPQIGKLTALTNLDLRWLMQLEELPPQIGQLTALTDLNLSNCRQLKKLPPQVGQLTALTDLNLNSCNQLTLARGAEKGQPAQTIVAAYAPLLIVAPHKDAPGELNAFLRANPLAVTPFFKVILTDAAHATWLGEAVMATPELAKLTDDIGRHAIESAHSACKQAMQAALFLLGRFDVDDGPLLHRSATAAVAAADDHGDPKAKPMPRVAIKAMRGAEQVRAELEGRLGLESKHVVAVKAVFADEEAVQKAVDAGEWEKLERAAADLEGVKLQRVPGLSSSIQAHLFKPDARQTKQAGGLVRQPTLSSLPSQYCFVLVLELADRSLLQTINHDQIAGKDWAAIRHIASDLRSALDHVHSKGGIHADFKPLNALGSGNTWKLIDFDVFCKVGEPFGNKIPSSGYCPPEMAKVLLAATDQDTAEVDTSLLTEYVASEAYDLWSFGVVLYHLCFGTPLWKTDINDNVDLEGLRLLASMADEPLRLALKKALNNGVRKNASIDLQTATTLLRKLLEPDPSKRLKHFEDFERPMEAVLDEPFFQGQSLDAASQQIILTEIRDIRVEQDKQMALLTAIKELSTENKIELRHTREALMKGIFEATEVSTPTTFIVLNEELPEPTSEEEKKQLMHEIAEDGSGVTVTGELASVTFTEDGPRVEAVGKCKEYVDKFNTGMKWVHRLKTIGSKVAAGKVGDAFETIKEGLGDLVTGETMYLYLMDELTCEPVRAEGYPIVITKPSEIVPKLLPVMQVGLRAMSIYNGAGGIARLFGYPVPKVPKAWAKGARESVELLKQESSVAQFGVVHEEVMDGSEESKSVRGHSLRVFTDFLQKNDPGLKAGKSGNFAGLQRIGDSNDGTALWTTLTDPQEIRSALEARTREREAEARDGGEFIQRAVKGLARQAEVVALLEKRAGERREEEQRGDDLFSALAFTPSEAANAVVTLREELKAARAELETARAVAKAAQGDKPSGGCCSVL